MIGGDDLYSRCDKTIVADRNAIYSLNIAPAAYCQRDPDIGTNTDCAHNPGRKMYRETIFPVYAEDTLDYKVKQSQADG